MNGQGFEMESRETKRIETKHRRIVTPIPVPESFELIKEMQKYEPISNAGQPLIVSVFVYKSMSFKDLINVLRSASVNMAMVMMIIGFSSIFSYIFALEGMGQKIVDFMLSITTSPTGLFFLVIAFMVVIGCFMESLAALPIILPIIYPMFASLGVNLNQLGVVFALSTVLGGLTPPVGIYLFLSMNLTGSKMRDTVLPHMLIVIGIMLLVIVLCILLPIPQFLPDLVFGAAT